MANIDKNGRGLAFIFCSVFGIFQLFENGSKRPKNTLGVVENDSKACSLCL